MEVDIWCGDWGLPSVDLFCLQTMAYAKFSGAPLKYHKTNNPWKSPNGRLPVFRQGVSQKLTDFNQISSHLRKESYSADFDLSPSHRADVIAFTSLLKEKLLPAILYTWWIDSVNYVELTRPWYAKALPFPLNYFVPGRMRLEAENYIRSVSCIEDVNNKVETVVIIKSNAQECLRLLESKLGSQNFFFGQSPSSLDAVVFGYLAPVLNVPFPNPAIKNLFKEYENLEKFVGRILRQYFPSPLEEIETKSSKQKDNDSEFPHKLRNKILAGLFATFTMVIYAFASGLVQVEMKDDSVNDLEDDDEID